MRAKIALAIVLVAVIAFAIVGYSAYLALIPHTVTVTLSETTTETTTGSYGAICPLGAFGC